MIVLRPSSVLKLTSFTRVTAANRTTPFHFVSSLGGFQFMSSNVISPTGMSKTVVKNILSVEQNEGVGARVRRSVGKSELPNLDPFLMLDEFRVKYPAGFPDHPHRGFETVTYMLKGACQHEDFCGHKGIISPGDLQWMTAGRGIVHCEMPHGKEEGHGLQLWINLSKKDKMIAPAYQELLDKDIPKATKDGVTVKVIAGESFDIKSPVYTRTPTMYLDFKMEQGSKFYQKIAEGWSAFIYILSGNVYIGPAGEQKQCSPHHTIVLSENGDGVEVENKDTEVCHLVLLGGEPIKEPVVQHGIPESGVCSTSYSFGSVIAAVDDDIPSTSRKLTSCMVVVSKSLCDIGFSKSIGGPFVMNTEEEIKQTFSDYRSGKNGFENAVTWKSEYVKKEKTS